VPGVTAIPHLGASTPESEDNCAIMAAQQLTDYIERGEIKNSVNLPATSLPALKGTRVCIIHNKPLSLPACTVGNTRGDVTYTVIDGGDVDADAIAAMDGVLRVRVLKG